MELEELVTTASEDELAARAAAAKTQSVRAFTRKRPVRKPWPDDIERERVVIEAPTNWSFSIRSSRCTISASLADSSARALTATASACSRASRSACSAARALTRSDGRSSGFDVMKPLNQITLQIQTVKRLSDPRWSQRFLRVAPIDSGQKVVHLRR